MNAIDTLRLVYPHHKDFTGAKECDEHCYRCEIERYAKQQCERAPQRETPKGSEK